MKKIFSPLHFLELAAGELIRAFEKPGDLLFFLTNNANHMHAIQVCPEDDERQLMTDRSNDFVFETLLLLQEVVRAWYNNPEDPVEPMARGIMEVVDHMGADGWANMVSRFRAAFSRDANQGASGIKYTDQLLRHYTAFCLTISHIKDHEAFQRRDENKVAA